MLLLAGGRAVRTAGGGTAAKPAKFGVPGVDAPPVFGVEARISPNLRVVSKKPIQKYLNTQFRGILRRPTKLGMEYTPWYVNISARTPNSKRTWGM
jgi:hypothetical protein